MSKHVSAYLLSMPHVRKWTQLIAAEDAAKLFFQLMCFSPPLKWVAILHLGVRPAPLINESMFEIWCLWAAAWLFDSSHLTALSDDSDNTQLRDRMLSWT